MIPKVIHYCWFGGQPLNELSKCMASWKRLCPEYELVRWDETNYDVAKNEYMRTAYEAGKWAFVSDYARLDILYRHGGIYLDTDVELIRSLDWLLAERAFMGIEYSGYVNTGLGIGGEPGVELFRKLRDAYDAERFLRPDGSPELVPCTYHQTKFLEALGYVMEDRRQCIDGVTFLPSSVLASRDWYYGTLKTTEDTVAVHHGAATWLNEEQRALRRKQHELVNRFGRRLGGFLANAYRGGAYLANHGLPAFLKKLGVTGR